MGMSYINQRSNFTDSYKLNMDVYKIDEDILFMGSSRAHHVYVPSVIEDTLGTPVYNAALWGRENIYFQYAMLNLILERYTPTIIFYEVHPIDILKTSYSDTERLNILSPYIGISDATDSLMESTGKYTYYKLSHLYRYNGDLINDLCGITIIKNSQLDGGYKPLYAHVKAGEKPDDFNFPIDSVKLDLMNKFISLCKKNDIKLVFTCSPMYLRSPQIVETFDKFDSIAVSNQIPYIDNLSNAEIVNNPSFFADRGHLNDEGAHKFSSIFAHQAKNLLGHEKK